VRAKNGYMRIYRLFSYAIFRTAVQQLTRIQLT